MTDDHPIKGVMFQTGTRLIFIDMVVTSVDKLKTENLTWLLKVSPAKKYELPWKKYDVL